MLSNSSTSRCPTPKIILRCSRGYDPRIDTLVEDFIRDGVKLIAVMGEDCSRVEDIIDELIVGTSYDESRFILTSFHEDETLEEVLEFVWSYDPRQGGWCCR